MKDSLDSKRMRKTVRRITRSGVPMLWVGLVLRMVVPSAQPYWGLLLALAFVALFGDMLLDPRLVTHGPIVARSTRLNLAIGILGLCVSLALAAVALGAIVADLA